MSYVWTHFENGHSGPGWYVFSDEHPCEGSVFCESEKRAELVAEKLNKDGEEGADHADD